MFVDQTTFLHQNISSPRAATVLVFFMTIFLVLHSKAVPECLLKRQASDVAQGHLGAHKPRKHKHTNMQTSQANTPVYTGPFGSSLPESAWNQSRNKRQNEVSWTPTGEQLSLVFAIATIITIILYGAPMCSDTGSDTGSSDLHESTIKHTRLPLFYRRGNYHFKKIKNPLPRHITSWLHGWTSPEYMLPALNYHLLRINGEHAVLTY